MKKITNFLIITTLSMLLLCNHINAQQNCVTELSQAQIDYMNDTQQERENMDTGFFEQGVITIPLAVHIIRDSNRIGGLKEDNLLTSIEQLNNAFQQAGFEFSLCSTNYINNNKYYNDLTKSFQENSDEFNMAIPNLVAGSINVFYAPNSRGNWSSFPFHKKTNGKDWIVMNNAYAADGSTLAHEMGHYFNLYHTHENFIGLELANGSNCETAGDELCDTPAEPYINSKGKDGMQGCVNTACNYICDDTDENNEAYEPKPENIMSYAPASCKNKFSPLQINRMQQSYMNDRNYLLGGCEQINLPNCKVSDKEALLALYKATNGANWNNKWDLNTDHKSWHGVSVNDEGCVEKLFLNNNNLTGSIPEEISNLTQLNTLALYNNQLTGMLPKTLINLTELTNLRTYSNNLSGCYDPELKSLCDKFWHPTDDKISLGNNFDASWGDFCVNENGICESNSCEATDKEALLALYNATNGANWNVTWDLNTDHKSWHGVSVNDEGCVEKLFLNNNNLTGSIPEEISNLIQLNTLSLYNNQLTGKLPKTLINLTELTNLRTYSNNLSGCYDPELKSLCDKFWHPTDDKISLGNNFDASWGDFCINGNGICVTNNKNFLSGDYNKNGIVNHQDALYLGVSYGKTGIACDATNIADCPNWKDDINGINTKYIDGDRNGIINEADVQVIEDNYGVTSNMNNTLIAEAKEFSFRLEWVDYLIGSTAKKYFFEVFIENLGDGITEIKGFASSINFGNLPVVSPKVRFFDSNFETTINVENYNPTTNTMDFALTCLDDLNLKPNYPVAELIFIIENNIDGGGTIKFSDAITINATGELSEGIDSSYNFYGLLPKLNSAENAGNPLSQNYPNPFSLESNINYFIPKTAKASNLKVYNLAGNLIQKNCIDHTGSGNLKISSKNLEPGLYIYTLEIDGMEISSKKMIVQ